MKKFLPLLFLLVFFCRAASAQVAVGQNPSNPASVTLRGQVYMPGGSPYDGTVGLRIQLSGEDGRRPPDSFFTDSKGGFVISGMSQGASYTLVVESDGRNWATTKQIIWVLGPRPYVTLQLRALESTRPATSPVSVAELNQNVPRNARKEYETAVEQLTAGDTARARKGFEMAIALYPDFVEARSELAVVLMREGNLAGAEILLRRAIEIDTAAVHPQLNLGLCLYRQQRYSEALPFLERGVQLQPVNPNGNLVLGMTLVMAGDDGRAEPVLRKAYEQGGKRYAKAQLYLSRIYTRQKKYDRAAEALDVYLRDVPDEPNAESLRATLVKLRAASHP
ncbi:MAG TPA: tetratricopeptide repeat protein [Candidatus Acidoferrales bacterium]|nr:tetratricopeptide repeat protein [Candidatus Acidoferrales bacterium]